jgi:hypothetical protein
LVGTSTPLRYFLETRNELEFSLKDISKSELIKKEETIGGLMIL